MLPIDQIIVKNKYLRTETNVDKLIKSIETVGLINPLIINEKNELIAGGRRYTALKEMNVSEVPVYQVDKNEKEQELISIDENLVRKDLTKVEFEKCLNRGREIYEELYPAAKKITEEDLTIASENELNTQLPNEQRSFIDITAEKTGLSKKVIKGAIDRDAKSSKKVKELRHLGELNASQTNEIIKLDEDQQEKLIDLVKEKSAKEIKDIVKNVSQRGIDKAMDDVMFGPTLPKEYSAIQNLSKRVNKLVGKILLEEMKCEHEDKKKIFKTLSTLRNQLDELFTLNHHSDSINLDKITMNTSPKVFSEETKDLSL